VERHRAAGIEVAARRAARPRYSPPSGQGMDDTRPTVEQVGSLGVTGRHAPRVGGRAHGLVKEHSLDSPS